MKQLLQKLGWNLRPLDEERDRSRESNLGLLLRQRLEGSSLYAPPSLEAPIGYFNGRHIIGESTRVNGGVYIGILPQEAVVVDEKYRKLDEALDTLVRKLLDLPLEALSSERIIIRAVVEHARSLMRVDYPALRRLDFHQNRQDDQKVMLDAYLEAGVGAPRHIILLKAYFLEQLSEREMLKGNPVLHLSITNDAYVVENLTYETSDGRSYRA